MHFTNPSLLSSLILTITLSTLPPLASAHGFVQEVRNAGHSYPGRQPWWWGSPWPHVASAGWPQRNQNWGYVSPSEYASPNITCGKHAEPPKTAIPVAAGSKVELLWTPWPDSHHGPVLTYMARCPGDCFNVDKDTLEFFKIDEGGMLSKGQAPGTWASDTLISQNSSWTITVPPTLAAGSYVLRHEIIALHSANTANGAQNYPQCFTLKVSGTGTANPAADTPQVAFKATQLYKYSGAGILVNIYYPALTSYRIPGPAVWKGAVVAAARQVRSVVEGVERAFVA